MAALYYMRPEREPACIPMRFFPALEQLPVHFELRKEHRAVPEHKHEFYEIALVVKGSARHISSGVTREVKPGCVLVVPTGVSHAWEAPRNLELLNIYYRADRLVGVIGAADASASLSCLFFCSDFFENSALRAALHFQAGQATIEIALRELREMQNLSVANAAMRETFCIGGFLKLLSLLAADYDTSRSLSRGHHQLQPQVYRLLEILNQYACTGKTPRVAEHAAGLGISTEHLSRIFTRTVGSPPLKYFNRRRLEHAKDLLRRNTLTNTEVAYRLGFSDSSHFCRMFKETFHFTPSEFKRRSNLAQAGARWE